MQKVLFAGSANQKIAGMLSVKYGLPIGKSKLTRFANSEIKVTIEENVEGKEAIVVQSIANPANDRLVELAFYIDALKRQGAEKVNLIIPYFGYARQNVQHSPGECVSVHVVIKLLESLGASEITTLDLHDEGTAGIFSIPFLPKSALPLLAKEMRKDIDPDSAVVVAPDQGAIERARVFATAFFEGGSVPELVTAEKKRNLAGVHDSKALELYGNVKGKIALFPDDVATSGKTVMHAAQLCLDHGAKEVYAAVVHADFGQGVIEELQKSPLKAWYTTDTIEDMATTLTNIPFFHLVPAAPAL